MIEPKIIQSFVPFSAGHKPDTIITKNYAYLALLSSLQLNKLYGEVTLYTNNAMGKFFRDLDFPYIIDTSLEGEQGHYFAMPKLKAFLKQDKPFFHFDLDSLVFEKPLFYEKNSPFIFSHRDMPNAGYTKEDRSVKRKKHKAVTQLLGDIWFDNLMESYLKAYYNCEWLPEDYPTHFINPNNIPNMNLIGVKDVDTFKQATITAMEIAEKNVEIFTRNWLASNFIEQLTIPLYCQALNKKYGAALASKHGAITSPFTFSGDPFTCTGFPEHDDRWQNVLPSFPFEFKHFYQCGECGDQHEKNIKIASKKDLIDNLDLSKFRYAHIGGANKEYALWQAMIIHTIVENFGTDLLFKVTEYYRKRDQDRQITLRFSAGEILYEELTGNKLFTKTFRKNLKLSVL